MGYYSFVDLKSDGINKNSRESRALPLIVNCAGKTDLCEPFTTYNKKGRLDYYLMYITEGRLTLELDGQSSVASGGDFIIFPPHYKYKYTLTSGRVIYLFAHFTGGYPEALLAGLGIGVEPAILHAGHSEEASAGFFEIFDAYIRNDAFRDLELGAALERTLISLAKAAGAKQKTPLCRSLSYIKSSYTEDIRIPTLAAMESLSVSRYNTLFKATVGKGPVAFITDLRMKHACSLLCTTDLPVKKIGQIVGYADNHFFSKLFKKYIGLSPANYREKNSL